MDFKIYTLSRGQRSYLVFTMAAVIVHGGAYAIPDDIADRCEAGCREVSKRAYEVLKSGKSALDAGSYPWY